MTDESLIDDTAGNEPAPENQEEGSSEEQYAWFWNDDQQGEGDAPEWFKANKYKSVADQAKAYTEAEKQLGAFKGAPEEYTLDLPEGIEAPEGVDVKVDPEDPLAQEFSKWAKENNVSQEAFTEILGMYISQQVRDYQAASQTTQAEMERLGDNANKRLDDIAKWGRANMDDETFDKFRSSLVSADAVEMAEFFIGKSRNVQMPDPSNINPNLMATKTLELKELQAAKDDNGKLKWFTDPNHRARIEALQKEIYGEGEYRQIVG